MNKMDYRNIYFPQFYSPHTYIYIFENNLIDQNTKAFSIKPPQPISCVPYLRQLVVRFISFIIIRGQFYIQNHSVCVYFLDMYLC